MSCATILKTKSNWCKEERINDNIQTVYSPNIWKKNQTFSQMDSLFLLDNLVMQFSVDMVRNVFCEAW